MMSGRLAVFLALLSLSACAPYPWSQLTGQGPRPVRTLEMNASRDAAENNAAARPVSADGSLWKAGQSKAYLFQDPKAGRRGDIVQVQVVENANGSKSAVTKTLKTSTATATTGATLGLPLNTTNNLGVTGSYADNFDGEGSTTRNQALTAVVPSEVTDVLPNGNLVLYGRREVVINSEKTLITLSGIIRPEDIGPLNTISSTSMSDAKIEYTGRGVVSDKNQPGWFVRLMNWIWPF